MMKTFLVYAVCVCLHFIFTECFHKKNYKLKKNDLAENTSKEIII